MRVLSKKVSFPSYNFRHIQGHLPLSLTKIGNEENVAEPKGDSNYMLSVYIFEGFYVSKTGIVLVGFKIIEGSLNGMFLVLENEMYTEATAGNCHGDMTLEKYVHEDFLAF